MPDTNLPHHDLIEAERRRLAEQLTSSIIAPLNLLLSQASAYEQTLSANPQVGIVVAVLTSLARQVLQQALDLQANLHPALLEVLGLEAALETLAQQQQRTSGAALTLKLDQSGERLPAPLELALFRAIQDGVACAIKQAKASQLDLTLTRRVAQGTHEVTLWLRDNGSTFMPRQLLTDTVLRIQALGGEVMFAADSVRVMFRLLPSVELTTREHDVLKRLAESLTNKEIAQRLSIQTVIQARRIPKPPFMPYASPKPVLHPEQ